jgi:hypothetical protein
MQASDENAHEQRVTSQIELSLKYADAEIIAFFADAPKPLQDRVWNTKQRTNELPKSATIIGGFWMFQQWHARREVKHPAKVFVYTRLLEKAFIRLSLIKAELLPLTDDGEATEHGPTKRPKVDRPKLNYDGTPTVPLPITAGDSKLKRLVGRLIEIRKTFDPNGEAVSYEDGSRGLIEAVTAAIRGAFPRQTMSPALRDASIRDIRDRARELIDMANARIVGSPPFEPDAHVIEQLNLVMLAAEYANLPIRPLIVIAPERWNLHQVKEYAEQMQTACAAHDGGCNDKEPSTESLEGLFPASHFRAERAIEAKRLESARRDGRLKKCKKIHGRWLYSWDEVKQLYPEDFIDT